MNMAFSKKIKLLLLFIVVCTSNSFSQKDSSFVDFVSYWSVGDYYEFTVTKTKKQWKDEQLIKDEENSYIASFNVIDSSATTYTIKWVYENDLGNTYQLSDEVLQSLAKYDSMEVIYITTEVGAFIEVVNWKELSEFVSNLFDDLKVAIAGEDKDKLKKIDRAFKVLKKAYGSKEGIETLLLKELQYMHFPMGMAYSVNDTIVYEDLLPNLIGGDPVRGNTMLYIDSLDKKNSFCVLKQEMKLNEDDTKQLIKDVFKKLNLSSKKYKKAMKNATYAIDDNNVYEFYYYPGVPHKIVSNRRTKYNFGQGDITGLDQVKVELRYQDPPIDSLNCAKFKTGKFLLNDKVQGITHIERIGSKQIEYNEKSKVKLESEMFWLDECTFSLKLSKIIENPNNIELPEGLSLTIEIIGTKNIPIPNE